MRKVLFIFAIGALVLNLCAPDRTAGYHGCCADLLGRVATAMRCQDFGKPAKTPALTNLHHSCCVFTEQHVQHAPPTPLGEMMRAAAQIQPAAHATFAANLEF